MSNIAIQGAATGTGVFTLASPATNTDRVITLPDEAGTLITTASTGVVAEAMLETLVVPIGVDQTWQDVLASRSAGVTYTNTTGRPIAVAVSGSIGSFANYQILLTVDGVVVQQAAGSLNGDGGCANSVYATVPAGATYSAAPNAGTLNLDQWAELR